MVYGEIKNIIIQKESDWGKYRIKNSDGVFTAVGVIPDASVGMSVTLEGRDEKTKYGDQFTITHVLKAVPDESAGVLRFLSDGYIKGIGAVKAKAIVKTFGNDSLRLFDTPDGNIRLTDVRGITSALIEKSLPSYEENKKYLPIVLFLKGSGTKRQVEQIYEKYGDETVHVLKKNPYRLQMDVDGFGFLKADRLAIAAGIRPDSEYRVMAAIKYILEIAAQTNGHCYLLEDEIKERMFQLLVPAPKFPPAKEMVVERVISEWNDKKTEFIKKYHVDAEGEKKVEEVIMQRNQISQVFQQALFGAVKNGDLINDLGKIYTPKMYEAERDTAEMILKMSKKKPVRVITDKKIEAAIKRVEERKTEKLKEEGASFPFAVTEEQRAAVFNGLTHRIAIISGGPGRGKTAIGEIIAETFLSAGEHYDKSDILMLAPTGRAAQRMTESTGYEAMTAHRAVMALRNDSAPKGKLILCDEASMVDIFLAKQILAYSKDCNLIFVGDVNQIASVGPGKVLRDMISSGTIPCTLLQKGHRNAGSIAMNSDMILQGKPISNYVYDEHFVYVPVTSENILNTMITDYLSKVRQYGVKNVMLCAAMRERGPVAVSKLNASLQEIVTKGQKEAVFKSRRFRVGDRVMQQKNDYNFIMKKDGKYRQGVFNGEKGSIVNILPDYDEDSYRLVVLFDDGSIGGYTKNTIDNLVLAYATTLHKCQGSEADCMMMAYTFADYMLLNRSLFYTGETRAKREFRFYGEEKLQYGRMLSAFDMAVKKVDDAKRNTMLAERIKAGHNI